MSSRPPNDEDETEETPQAPEPTSSSPDARTEQPEPEQDTSEDAVEEQPVLEEEDTTQIHHSRIVILGERDIPFEEERPPNFLPNFQVKVHRVSRPEKPREVG